MAFAGPRAVDRSDGRDSSGRPLSAGRIEKSSADVHRRYGYTRVRAVPAGVPKDLRIWVKRLGNAPTRDIPAFDRHELELPARMALRTSDPERARALLDADVRAALERAHEVRSQFWLEDGELIWEHRDTLRDGERLRQAIVARGRDREVTA